MNFKVQFQSVKFALWKIERISNLFQPIRKFHISGRFFLCALKKIVVMRSSAFEKLKKDAIFCILEL